MELTVTTENNTLIVESPDRDHTVLNLLRKTLWDSGVQAGYDQGHPYIDASKLIIKADDAEKALKKAVKTAQNDLKEFKSAFNKAF